jgi:low affinity Fe/Cu permease
MAAGRGSVVVPGRLREVFARFAIKATQASGSAWAFVAACLVIVLWVVTGPIFRFSDTWQLVINTGTTIVTFLMVFLIQHSQNRDTRALHLKLDELIAAVDGASNHLIDIEEMDEADLERMHERFRELAQRIQQRREHAHAATSVERVREEVGHDVEATKREHRAAKRGRPG